jgi:putative two-component system protein, hydrogenase maturation factor HypX/HoxX
VEGRKTIKLPAAEVLSARLDGSSVPNHSALFDGELGGLADSASSCQEITYRRHGSIGRLTFDFYNGAMSTARCRRLFIALRYAIEQDTAALVVEGGSVFSNGIDLNTIEAAANPALEAWRNINAINDICREIIDCGRQPLVAAISGNAGAGGVMLALGAHRVVVRSGVVLNPHYAKMGLYGSEYWTYALPRRIGGLAAARLTTDCQPLGAAEAVGLGMADAVGPADRGQFELWLTDYVRQAAAGSARERLLESARARRQADEQRKPLDAYRAEELAEMSQDMFSDRCGFAEARAAFVYKRR